MSTRVQKGGTIFKPVAKARSRPPDNSGRVSSTPDPPSQRSSTVHPNGADNAAPSSSMMPPPPTIPARSVTPAVSQTGASDGLYTIPESPSSGLPIVIGRSASRPPSIILSRATPAPPTLLSLSQTPSTSSQSIISMPPSQRVQPSILASPSRAAPTPIAIGSRAIPSMSVRSTPVLPVLPPPAPAPHLNSIPPASGNPPHSDSTSSQPPETPLSLVDAMMASSSETEQSTLADDMLQFDFSALIEHAARVANGETIDDAPAPGPRLQLNTENVVKPPRTRRKKAPTATQDGAEAEPTEKRPRRTRSKKTANAIEEPADEEAEKPKRKRRIRRATPERDQEVDEESTAPRKRRRKSSSTPRKPRAPSASVFDPDEGPGEELDPTVVTMATLCEDTGQGRISSKAAQILDNHATWKRSNRERRARMKAIMEAKKYGRNEDDEAEAHVTNGTSTEPVAGPSMSMSVAATSKASTPAPPEVLSSHDEPDGGEGNPDFDYSQSLAISRFNVQIRIGPNGETIVDEESLFVDRVEAHDTENYTHVEESDATKFINSASYGKKFRGTRWSAEETELFYDALAQFGENYELISYVLPGRDRKSCKSKFKIEDKRNPARITHCLENRVPYDMQTLSRMTGKDFSGPTPIIRARTPPNLSQLDPEADNGSPSAIRKQSRTPGLDDDDDLFGGRHAKDADLPLTSGGGDKDADIPLPPGDAEKNGNLPIADMGAPGPLEAGASEAQPGQNKATVIAVGASRAVKHAPPTSAPKGTAHTNASHPVSAGPTTTRKKGKGKKDDEVEILGTIDGNEWEE